MIYVYCATHIFAISFPGSLANNHHAVAYQIKLKLKKPKRIFKFPVWMCAMAQVQYFLQSLCAGRFDPQGGGVAAVEPLRREVPGR